MLSILFACFYLTNPLKAQNQNIDSIQILLKKDISDTNKVNHLNALSRLLMFQNPDTSIILSKLALDVINQLPSPAEKTKYTKTLLAKTYGNLGNFYFLKSEYSSAIDFHNKALRLDEELGNKMGIATSLGNLGLVYSKEGDLTKTMDYYLRALKISEQIEDKSGIARHLGNIGIIYKNQRDYPKALDYYFKALKMAEELEDKNSIVRHFGNIGNVYSIQGDYPKALNCYFKALGVAKELGNKKYIANQLGCIGTIYKKKGNYTDAFDCYSKALKMAEELGDKNETAAWLSNIGSLYLEQKKYIESSSYLHRALYLDNFIGFKEGVKEDYEVLSDLYKKANIPLPDSVGDKLLNLEKTRLYALYYLKRSNEMKKSLFNEANRKELIKKGLDYQFEKKEALIKEESEIRQAVAEENNRKQKIITRSIVSGLLIILAFAGFIFRSLRKTRKQKQTIEIKNIETENQKKIIEEKNKDITDSIRYAKRIQDALMGEKAHISIHLPEHFILFMPKDIVSGDFHWGVEKQGHWYFAAVDCTGHGVPGAVMSMLGISFLNGIVASEHLLNPADILNQLRDKVVNELRQTGEAGGSKDGMDISLCRLNLKTSELQWAGANNALNLIRNGKLEEIKADKQPIGYYPESRPFTNNEIQMQKGDSIYLYSDGYADQFGGPKGKKFKYKQLEDLIVANTQLPMNDQKEILKNHFTEWKGSLEQIDDVCVFGVRV
ncbi:MAG: tetratricopeptide repeat protein [Bacteroidia bacterium]|nr:tetratricopeptide repeat protein [Bacteroidia bacterium]